MTTLKAENFIEEIIITDMKSGKHNGQIQTRFPPEPNGYLHIGHAKSILLNFGLAEKFGGKCNLRFDDTNPSTEETEYVESIKHDIQWLGCQWNAEYYASDYFENLYVYAQKLIQEGLAYVDDSTIEEINAMRGDTYKPGNESPYRQRSIEENLRLFEEMKQGKYKDGEKVLRAKIDMSNANMHFRDPIIYRIKHEHHHRTGSTWCIYPMYDFAHGQSDSIEKITHSICTLEFIPHRPLYDWFINKLNIYPSQQFEFARFNLSHTLMSKRKLLQLVKEGYVTGWDDPRMPTISGLRRKGYTPTSIRNLMHEVGVQKRDNLINIALLEHHIREDLNQKAIRAMAILNPLKVEIINIDDTETIILTTANNPNDASKGEHELKFGKHLFIEKDDFMEDAPNNYFRLKPDGYVRLRSAFIIKCKEIIKDNDGNIILIRAIYIPESRSGQDISGIKVKGVIHWLNQNDCEQIEVRLYENLFNDENPAASDLPLDKLINKNSLTIIDPAYIEPFAINDEFTHFQFLRNGYFVKDKDSNENENVFNKTVGLKDSWAKEVKKQ